MLFWLFPCLHMSWDFTYDTEPVSHGFLGHTSNVTKGLFLEHLQHSLLLQNYIELMIAFTSR